MTYPTSSSASDVWSLRDVYKAEAGDNWPELPFYTDATYGTLVGAFEGGWQPTAVSVTQGSPTPSSSNVILSDSNFQSVRANASSGLVYYVWGSSLENYAAFNFSEIESANISSAPTTTINPNSFGIFGDPTTGFRVHFHQETTGSDLSGSDYSIMSYKDTNILSVFDLASIKSVDSNTINSNYTASKVYIFYK